MAWIAEALIFVVTAWIWWFIVWIVAVLYKVIRTIVQYGLDQQKRKRNAQPMTPVADLFEEEPFWADQYTAAELWEKYPDGGIWYPRYRRHKYNTLCNDVVE